MRIHTTFEIKEEVEELRCLLRKERDGRKKERLHFLYLFKTRQVKYLGQAGVVLGRDRKTMSQWRRKYLLGGVSTLLERGTSPGRTPQVRGAALVTLKERLSDAKGFGSYQEIDGWVRAHLGIALKAKTLYHLCHYKLGATSKVARPSNPKKDDAAVKAFKKTSGATLRR